MRFKKAGDDGFSIIEVAIAAFVLFFTLTAMYALTVSSYRQSVTASRQSVATNFVASMFEQARSMPFNTLWTDADGGTLPSQETTTYQGIEFTVERDVAWVDDDGDGLSSEDADGDTHDYKEYVVTVHWTTMLSIPHSLTMSTYIRDTIGENVSADISLEWVREGALPTPLEGSVIFHTEDSVSLGITGVWDGVRSESFDPAIDHEAKLEASTTISTPGDGIASVQFTVDSLVIQNQYRAQPPSQGAPDIYRAYFLPPDPLQWDGYFYLNSLVTTDGVLFFPDGPRELEATVWSISGSSEREILNVIVDNDEPFFESETPWNDLGLGEPLTNAARYASEIVVNYPVAADGWRDAGQSILYNVTHWDVGVQTSVTATDSDTHSFDQVFLDYAELPSSGSSWATLSDETTTFVTTPFTAYRMMLWPRSVAGRRLDVTGLDQHFHTDWYITNSRLGATSGGTDKKPTVCLDLVSDNLTKYFGAYLTAGITYDVFIGSSFTGSGNLSGLVSGSSGLTYEELQDTEISVFPNKDSYLQVRANLPTDDGLSQSVVWSNVIWWDSDYGEIKVP